MPTWNPEPYLRFNEDRTLSSRELAARIRTARPNSSIDLGCGPGNSTAVLAELWPAARITGLDSSREMLDHARDKYPQYQWTYGDIAEWATAAGEPYDLVFSNAALHWLGDHETLFPSLLRRIAAGGTIGECRNGRENVVVEPGVANVFCANTGRRQPRPPRG